MAGGGGGAGSFGRQSQSADKPFLSSEVMDLWPGRLTSGKAPFRELCMGKYVCWQGTGAQPLSRHRLDCT